VTSCQFALHYFFESRATFYGFMRNVAECTKLHGYFIATCYDGRTLFQMLRGRESREIYDADGRKVWSVARRYAADAYENDDRCLGYRIDVYQDSINQTLPEYLVNFDFLTQTMETFGFALVRRDEARQLGLPDGSGMFSEMYGAMAAEAKKRRSAALEYRDATRMQDYEKDISFLNRYVAYKKVSTRNVEQLVRAKLEGADAGIDAGVDAITGALERSEVGGEAAAVRARGSKRRTLSESSEASVGMRPLGERLVLEDDSESGATPPVATPVAPPVAAPVAAPVVADADAQAASAAIAAPAEAAAAAVVALVKKRQTRKKKPVAEA
jgi:hypothetical protein